jgi:hypothetical protein
LSNPETKRLRVYCTSDFVGSRGIETSTFAFDEAGNLCMVLSSVESTIINSNFEPEKDDSIRQLSYKMDWKPDVALLRNEEFAKACTVDSSADEQSIEFFENLDFVSYYFAKKATEDTQ